MQGAASPAQIAAARHQPPTSCTARPCGSAPRAAPRAAHQAGPRAGAILRGAHPADCRWVIRSGCKNTAVCPVMTRTRSASLRQTATRKLPSPPVCWWQKVCLVPCGTVGSGRPESAATHQRRETARRRKDSYRCAWLAALANQAATAGRRNWPIFFRCTSSSDTAGGVMPAMRLAWPTVSGRCWASLARTSLLSPAMSA